MRRCGRTWRAEPDSASRSSARRELRVLPIDLPGATVFDQLQIEIDDVGGLRPARYRLIPELGGLEPNGHLGANSRRRTRDLHVLQSQCPYAADTPASAGFGHPADA